MKQLLLLTMAVVMTGCLSFEYRAYNNRIKEIDAACKRGDITEIQREEYKNEALKILLDARGPS